jgi:hypothetical protein
MGHVRLLCPMGHRKFPEQFHGLGRLALERPLERPGKLGEAGGRRDRSVLPLAPIWPMGSHPSEFAIANRGICQARRIFSYGVRGALGEGPCASRARSAADSARRGAFHNITFPLIGRARRRSDVSARKFSGFGPEFRTEIRQLRAFRFCPPNVSPTREREKPQENQRVEQPFANRLETRDFRAAGQSSYGPAGG